MTTTGPSAKPYNAVSIWCNTTTIFIEMLTKPPLVAPYILSFPRNTAGLSQALSLIFGHAEVSGPVNLTASNAKAAPLVGTPTQHAQASALLRRKGVLP